MCFCGINLSVFPAFRYIYFFVFGDFSVFWGGLVALCLVVSLYFAGVVFLKCLSAVLL